MKNPAVVGTGQYDGNGAVLRSCMNATTLSILNSWKLKSHRALSMSIDMSEVAFL
jgi:hypothetical protein